VSDAAIVLCGGRSRRMGRDKATLPFGDQTMLERVVERVGRAVDEIVLVAREGQEIAGGYTVVRDEAEGLGPLAGLAAGLEAISAERAFLTACDAPLIEPAYVRRLLELAHGHAVAVPLIDGYHMTTSAVYSRDVLPLARELVAERRLRPLFLIEAVDARIVTEDELRAIDPELRSLRNCNTPAEYEQALRDAGIG